MEFGAIFEKFPEIETERLILKEIRPENDKELFTFFSDSEVMRYYNLEPLKKIEQAEKIINMCAKGYENKQVIRWGIYLKKDKKIIGTCGYHNWAKGYFRAEIGYELSKDYWQKGIMSEAVKAIMLFGFNTMGLNRIEALIETPNTASEKLLRKLGFQKEGLLREHAYYKNEFVDLIMFSLLKKDFMIS